ncbi:hypothetical protein C0J52_08842 [Blattella germanica]|nr:hypothetical protein C0J52_08842 [Blattella germanica]
MFNVTYCIPHHITPHHTTHITTQCQHSYLHIYTLIKLQVLKTGIVGFRDQRSTDDDKPGNFGRPWPTSGCCATDRQYNTIQIQQNSIQHKLRLHYYSPPLRKQTTVNIILFLL